jgi:hypothetical protein
MWDAAAWALDYPHEEPVSRSVLGAAWFASGRRPRVRSPNGTGGGPGLAQRLA